MRKIMMFAAVAALTLGMSNAMADGKALFTSKGCVACHGADAKTSTAPMYPKLAGQNAAYATAQMKDIKSGARANGMTAVMKPIISTVSDEEIAEIAAWLESLK